MITERPRETHELLARYDVPGPRYTSYPTVPYWTDLPTADQWVTHLGRRLEKAPGDRPGETPAGGALYVHIPFCESLCTYCGCNTKITRNHGMGAPYVDAVLAEWRLYRERLPGRFPLAELHLGGGTPTFLEAESLGRLVDGLADTCEVLGDAEFSIEADPRVTTREHLATLAKRGFTRLSLGIQDFDPRVQEAVNRVQSADQVARVVDEARGLGFRSINFDLIYGLPFQTKESIEGTVAVVSRLRPDRIAFYGYAHVPWIKPWQRRFTEDDLPAGAAKRSLYEAGRGLLEAAGYREIGMDHFALETDPLWQASDSRRLHRNFMGYTSRFILPLIGLGVSSIGDAGDAFAQNDKVLETYLARIGRGELPVFRGHVLDAEDQVLRRHILNLMTRLETDWSHPADRVEFLDRALERLAPLADDGLVELKGTSCRVTPTGRAFLRNICMALDARLARKSPDHALFSRSI